jgi:hypothetical protein
MRTQHALLALTVANLALLLVGAVQQVRPVIAASELPVLRGRALEIVDAQGRVRASISVLPDPSQSETVLLRLITERGRPSVKIAAAEPQSGVSFAGPTGTKATYAILEAKQETASLTLHAENGREQVLTP